MQLGIRAYALPLLEQLCDRLILAELGFVDRSALRVSLDHARDTPAVDSSIVDLLRVELGLRSLWSGQGPADAVRPCHDARNSPRTERRHDAAALA